MLVTWRAPDITATNGSRVESHHRTLWEQAEGRLDVSTRRNRGTLLFWLQSRPFTLAARVLQGARHHSYEWIKSGISPPDYGSKRKEDWTSLPATKEELCRFGYNHDHSRSLLGCCTTSYARCCCTLCCMCAKIRTIVAVTIVAHQSLEPSTYTSNIFKQKQTPSLFIKLTPSPPQHPRGPN